jgi:hypothetical protein
MEMDQGQKKLDVSFRLNLDIKEVDDFLVEFFL